MHLLVAEFLCRALFCCTVQHQPWSKHEQRAHSTSIAALAASLFRAKIPLPSGSTSENLLEFGCRDLRCARGAEQRRWYRRARSQGRRFGFRNPPNPPYWNQHAQRLRRHSNEPHWLVNTSNEPNWRVNTSNEPHWPVNTPPPVNPPRLSASSLNRDTHRACHQA
jgi:hypothetical protein